MKAAFFTHNDPHRERNMIDYVYAKGRQKTVADLCDLHPVRITPSNFDTEADALKNLDVIFSTWGMFELTDEMLDRLPNLKAVFYAAGSVKSFAEPLLTRGIKVTSSVNANAIPVAEFCLAQILLSAKGYFGNNRHCREKVFRQDLIGPGVYGETIALIGIGAISRHLLKLLQPFNLRVIAVSRYLSSHPELAASMGIDELVSIEEAFKRAIVVSNHLPDHGDNRNIFVREHFASMRKGATFINTGRGVQVDEAALIDVMNERKDLTALLDVLWNEPPREDDPIYEVPNIHLSAHISGSQNDETVRMADYAIEECSRFLSGKALQYEVTLEQFASKA